MTIREMMSIDMFQSVTLIYRCLGRQGCGPPMDTFVTKRGRSELKDLAEVIIQYIPLDERIIRLFTIFSAT